MPKHALVPTLALMTLSTVASHGAHWATPRSPAIPQASGYVVIPNVAMPPSPTRTYRAVFDARQAAERPSQLIPAVDNAASELNDLAVVGAPPSHARFVLVFHGPALEALLDDAHYRARHKVANPNLPVLAELKKAGVRLFACGQNLASEEIDPATLTRDVTIASDALIVLMTLQNDGYALLSF